ncbi:MAG: hypothetical protein CI947_2252 [Halanaerobium sp.]|nr:MAG: hypothetical protein CI947_2252 [Halanaerobium sp.]
MDQSLEQKSNIFYWFSDPGFNPYSSGSVIGTLEIDRGGVRLPECFNPYSSGSVIGILVDQSLEQLELVIFGQKMLCFNPYSSGSVIGTKVAKVQLMIY